jgi:hypothetical protein
MLSNSHDYVRPASKAERAYLEQLIRADLRDVTPPRRWRMSSAGHPSQRKTRGCFAIGWPLPRFAPQPVESKRHSRLRPNSLLRFSNARQAAGRTPKSFGLSIRSASVYLSRTALNASSPS